ncbi:MAG: hypothetical protein QOF55_461 [Thermoleophilaceae bacterium]|jgi:hypothetical protein|nr:hypothetical protein [Thermoleophilaceae bacterium]
MRVLADPVVDWGKLGQVVLYSLGAGIGVTACFALAVLGAIRFGELRRGPVAFGYGLLATLGLAVTVGAVVVAIIVMTTKG